MENVRRWLSGAKISTALFIVGVIVLTIASFAGQLAHVASGNKPTPTATVTPTATPTQSTKCSTWATAPSDYGNNRWFANGIAEIKTAKTATEATNAAHVWLAEVRKDPNLLAGAAKYFFDENVAKATLTDNGCATDKAVQLVSRMELAIGQSKVVATQAPAGGYNSGVDKGVVVVAQTAGLSGDLKAVQITFSDGHVIWILSRCGNVVTAKPSRLPPGKTDNQPRKPTKKTCPPGFVGTPPSCLESKIPSQDPFPQGNAPVGGGLNQDPGPGTYVPPAQMQQPPATVRVNPTPPAPAATTPPVGSTPDPAASAPAPEPSAPPPTAPATGTSCAPGIPVC